MQQQQIQTKEKRKKKLKKNSCSLRSFTSLHFINCLVPEDLKTLYCCVPSSFPQKRSVCFSFYKDIVFDGKLKH